MVRLLIGECMPSHFAVGLGSRRVIRHAIQVARPQVGRKVGMAGRLGQSGVRA